MIKLLLCLYCILLSFPTVVSNKLDEYLSNVNTAYEKYNVCVEEKENYTVAVVQGICNGSISCGVFLSSYEPGAYVVKIFVDGKEYALASDSRKDTLVYSVNIPNKETFVCVYDSVGNASTKRWEMKLTVHNEADLESLGNINVGMNQGIEVSAMTRQYSLRSIIIFVISISSFIVLVGILVIVFLKKNKKGVFSDNLEENDLKFFDFNEHADESSEELNNDNNIVLDDSEVKEVYEKRAYYDNDEDNNSSVKDILKENDYRTDYNNMTEEEKNKVMLFLMKLRYQNKISEEQYKEEANRLWRKY